MVAAAVLLPALLFVVVAWLSHRQALSDGASRLVGATRVAEEQAMRILDSNEVVAQTILNFLGSASDAEIRRNEADLHQKLRTITANLGHIQSVWIWDAAGRPLVSNRFFPVPRDLDVTQRPFFKWHAETDARFFVAEPVVARLTNEVFFDTAFRRTRDDGSFAGIISVSLLPQHFADFYGQIASDQPGLELTLFRADGMILASGPQTHRPGARLPEGTGLLGAVRGAHPGTFVGDITVESEARLAAADRLPRYSLYVAATMDRAALLAGWRRDIGLLGAFILPLALLLALAAWVAIGRARRELEISGALRAEMQQRERAERALVQAQKLEALGRLTGGVAHDFNNLLMVVANNVYLLKNSPSDTGSKVSLAAIERAVGSATKLTRQLLAFSRRQPVHPEPIRLQAELDNWASLIRPILTGGVKLEARAEGETPAVLVDRAGLELAVLNVAVNAADAMPAGGVFRVLVRPASAAESEELKGSYAVVEMSDTGRGIPSEVLPHIFDPFFTTKPPDKGTGLGLSQVYGFCRQAGGAVRVDSVAGQGTRVRLFLAPSAVKPETREQASARRARLPASVLLVDDNMDVARACARALRDAGCQVTHVASAENALTALQARPGAFELLLTDIVMPGGRSGIELARLVRGAYPALKIALMTGYSEELVERPVDEIVLHKPFGPDELAAALASAGPPISTPALSARASR